MKTFSAFGGACIVLFLSIFTLLPSQIFGRTDPPPSDSSIQLQPLGHLECTILIDTNCVDQTLTLSAHLSYIFSGQIVPVVVDWSTGVTASKIIVEPPGFWSWDETNFGCDHFTNSIELNAGFYDGQPEILVSDGNCSSEAVLTVNSQGYDAISSYQWNTGFSGTPYTVNQSGAYSVTVADAYGCTTNDSIALQFSTPDEENCFGFCVDCSLDGLQGNNGVFPPTSGRTVCGQIALHNDSWYGFVAGSESITFEIVTSNCQNGDGLQVALFDNCNDLDAIACNPGCLGCSDVPLTLQYDAYVPGETYWLVIDGWVGDVCDFTIEAIDGSLSAPAPQPAEQPQGPTTVCPGATAIYSVPAVSSIGFYRWTAPEGASINGASNDELVNVGQGSTVTITFGAQIGNICVQTGNACHPLTAQQCLSVSVSPIPTTIKPSIIVCAEDLPYIWDEDPYPTLSTPGTYVLTSTPYVSYLGCDSLVRQTVVVKSPIIVNLGLIRICPGDCFSMAGENFCDPGNYSVVLESYMGCDSLVNFAIQQVNPNAIISGPTEITCSQPTVTLSSGSPTGNVWTDASGQILGTGIQLVVHTAGVYILQTTVTSGGVSCEAYDTAHVTANLVISDLTISGAEFGCFTDSLLLDAYTSALNPTFSWQTPGGSTLSGSTIHADVPGFYSVTVTDVNGCAGTATVTVPYTGGTPLAQATGDTLTCTQLAGQLDAYTDEPGATYSWTGPNGFTSNEEDPMVTETGQYVLVVTGTGGCANSATAQLVGLFDVPVANLAPSFSIICDSFPVLALQTNSSNVSFLWSGPNGFSSTQQTPQATSAGQYAVVVTDNISGCTTVANTEVFEDLVFLTIATVQITHPTIGQSNGSIDITVSGSNPPFTFAWYSNGALIAETEDLTDAPSGDYELIVMDSYGCTSAQQFTLTGISASNEAFVGSAWLISPNPNNGKFQLQAPAHTQGAVQWKVHDSRGKLVNELTGELQNKSFEIDLGAVPAGVYFLEIQSGGKSAWERIVVQR